MNSGSDFEFKDYLSMGTPQEEQDRPKSSLPYPDTSLYRENGHVSMPEAEQPQQEFPMFPQYSYDEQFEAADTFGALIKQPESRQMRHARQAPQGQQSEPRPQLDLAIPSITVQADEQQGLEIYSPLNMNNEGIESPYSSYDASSPFNQQFSTVASPAASPSNLDWDNDASGDELSWNQSEYSQGQWQDPETEIDKIMGEFFDNGAVPAQNGVVHVPGLSNSAAQPTAIPNSNANLRVPGNDYFQASSPSDYQYLSAPSSPSLAPSSPHSGRSSSSYRRPRAYSSPYDLSTDGDASSPGDSGIISGNKRRTKKNPSLHPCPQCDKKFTRAYNLRSHMRTHTHERPFACAVCGKAFARQHDRKRHEDLHTGEKRFVCQGTLADTSTWGCSRRFARADALGRHFRTEAGKSCMAPLLDDLISKVGQRENVSEGIIFLGVHNGEVRLDALDDDQNQTRRAVIMSALAEQLLPLEN